MSTDQRYKAHIAAMATASPPKVPLDEYIEVFNRHRDNRGQSQEQQDQFTKIMKATKIRKMAYFPFFMHKGTDRENIVCFGKKAGEPGPGEHDNEFKTYKNNERQVIWEYQAMRLSEQAGENLVKAWGGDVSEITHVISCHTTGWKEPGIACNLIHHLGLGYDTQKIELNYNGCFAGLSCIRTARDIIRAATPEERKPVVLVVSTEVASLQYNPDLTSKMDLVVLSLFSDGSAAFIMTTEGPWLIDDAGCSVIPGSQNLLVMTPEDPNDCDRNTYNMFLSPKAPGGISDYFLEGNGVQILQKMMAKRTYKDVVPGIACHPGGPRILDAVLKGLMKEGSFPENVLESSYNTLYENGNLGSAAVLFVLYDMLNSTDKDDVLALAFGPGVTVEHANLVRV